MRISTIQAFNAGVKGITNNYANVTRTQEQISSGKRLLTPADDPVASVRLLQLGQQQAKLSQFDANLTAATNSLTQQEAVMNSVTNVLQRVREITLEAGNGALSPQDRQALAQELGEREKELFGLMNTQNARGEYLFGGFQSGSPPFVKTADGYQYKGDEGQRLLSIGESRQVAINDNGKDLFANVPNAVRVETSGEGIRGGQVTNPELFKKAFPSGGELRIQITLDTEGQLRYEIIDPNAIDPDTNQPVVLDDGLLAADAEYHEIEYQGMKLRIEGTPENDTTFEVRPATDTTRNILDTVALLRAELENPADAAADKRNRQDVLAVSLQNIDNAMNKVLGVQTSVGARMNFIESTQNENAEIGLINKAMTSSLEDLDYAEALSRLSLQSVVLQAAQQSFVKISGLSLFNLMR